MTSTNDLHSPDSDNNRSTWSFTDFIIIIVGCGLIFAISFLLISRFVFSDDPSIPIGAEPTILLSLGLAAIEAFSLIIGVYFFGIRRRRYGWINIGFKLPNIGWLLLSLTISIFVIPLSGLITILVMLALGLPTENPQLEFLIPPDFTWISGIFMLLLGGILVPIAEEVFFRGVLYKWLRERWGIWVGVLVSSAIFGIVHIDIAIAVTAFILGIILALVYEYSDSLWSAVLIHAVNNSVKILILFTLFAFDIPMGI